MSETPNLRLLFDEPDCMAYVQILDDGKLVLHSEIRVEKTLHMMKKARHISDLIDDVFRSKGVKTLYTWGVGDEGDAYNEFLGFRPSGKEVVIPGYEGEPVYEFVKDL